MGNHSSTLKNDSGNEQAGGRQSLNDLGNNTMSEGQSGQGKEPVENTKSLDDLSKIQETFKCHENDVMNLIQTTKALQVCVDHSYEISTVEDMDDKSKSDLLKTGRHILKYLQDTSETHLPEVEKSLMDINKKIHGIVSQFEMKPKYEQEIEMLKERVNELEKEKKEAKAEIESLRKMQKLEPKKRSGEIQLFHSHSGNTIKDIETELEAMLKKELNGIEFMKCNSLSEVDHSKLLIVLCIIASRVGTDAKNAIQDVQCLGNTALLLFHIKESHALTNHASIANLTNGSFKQLGGIFDMAFVNGKGIYQCETNNNALKSVCAFIKKGVSMPSDSAGSPI